MIYDRTGAGDIEEVKVVDGREVLVVKTLLEQCKEVCPHWEILFGHLHSIDEETASGNAGLTQRGLKGPLNLGTQPQADTQETQEEIDDDATADEDDELYAAGTQLPGTGTSQTLIRGSADEVRYGMESPTLLTRPASTSGLASQSQGHSQSSTASSQTLNEETQPLEWEQTPERTLGPGRSKSTRSRLTSGRLPSQATSSNDDSQFSWGPSPEDRGLTQASQQPSRLKRETAMATPRGRGTPATPTNSLPSGRADPRRPEPPSQKRKSVGGGLLLSSPLVTTDDQPLFLSGDDDEYEDIEEEKPPQPKVPKGKGKQGDIASLIIERKGRLQGRKKLCRMDEEVDFKMQILKARDRRMAVKEMKYRVQAGEKSAEQRKHELAVLELEFKREEAKAQQEAHRLQMLQMKYQQGGPLDTMDTPMMTGGGANSAAV
ncbi:MAG: hypothetical protein JWM47_4477 [Acidimicrobiales bacterium]|nr:hypothetical protein [Acidimicrobiales bacterium]